MRLKSTPANPAGFDEAQLLVLRKAKSLQVFAAQATHRRRVEFDDGVDESNLMDVGTTHFLATLDDAVRSLR